MHRRARVPLVAATTTIVFAVMFAGCLGGCRYWGLTLTPTSGGPERLQFGVQGLGDANHAAAFLNSTFNLTIGIGGEFDTQEMVPIVNGTASGLTAPRMPFLQASPAPGVTTPFSFTLGVNSTDPWVAGLVLLGANNSVRGSVALDGTDGTVVAHSSDFVIPAGGGDFRVGGNLTYRFAAAGHCGPI